MLSCVGLFAGFAAGAALGGPWALLAPIVGVGLGLIADLTLMKHGLHGLHEKHENNFHVEEDKINHESMEV